MTMKKSAVVILIFLFLTIAGTAVEIAWPADDSSPAGTEAPWPGDDSADNGPGSQSSPCEEHGSGTGSDFGSGSWQQEDFSIYGYIAYLSSLETPLREAADIMSGHMVHLRLKGDWTPEEHAAFHIEADYRASYGRLNPSVQAGALALQLGGVSESDLLAAQGIESSEDFHTGFEIDHAWGLVNLGPADLKFGLCPIAWGTGYAFNPTSRVFSASSIDLISDTETPGTASIIPSLQLTPRWSLHGYVAFQDKLRSGLTPQIESRPENYPYALKLLGYLGSWDFSCGLIKEVLFIDADTGPSYDVEARRAYYAAGDFIGQLGNLGLYGEWTVKAPMNGNSIDFGQSFPSAELLQFVAGIEYNEFSATSLKAEYFFHGPGAAAKSDYNTNLLLAGLQDMLARDYLTLVATKTFIDYLDVTAASIINLNDRSLVFAPEIAYQVYDNFRVRLSSLIPIGPEGSELSGTLQSGPDLVDLFYPTVLLEANLSF